MINKYGHALEEVEIEDIENRVKLLLQNEEFISLVSGECYREKALRYKKNLKYIDLLVKGENAWRVIDYKSALSHSAEHLAQVGFYVNAIKEITGDEVSGYVCYLLKDGVKIVHI
jgi:exodeoxyribonuclease V beta subunit